MDHPSIKERLLDDFDDNGEYTEVSDERASSPLYLEVLPSSSSSTSNNKATGQNVSFPGLLPSSLDDEHTTAGLPNDPSINNVGGGTMSPPAMHSSPSSPSPPRQRPRLQRKQSRHDFNVEAVQGDRYDDAAVFLLEGIHNYKFDIHPAANKARKAFLQMHNPFYARIELFFSTMLLLIVIFEKPAVFEVPLVFPLIIEILCFIFLAWNFRLRAAASGGWNVYFLDTGRIIRVLILFAVMLDCLLFIILQTKIRPLRMFRPFFLINSLYASSVRRVLRQMAQSFFVIVDMMLLLIFVIAIWATMGFYLFSEDGKDPFFPSFEMSFVNLFVLVTTANYPDLMMPAFHRNKASPIFFVAFLLLGLYFLLNVFLALVFNSFHEKEMQKYKKIFLHKRTALRFAYMSALDPFTSGITFQCFADMFRYVCQEPKKLVLIFHSLNRSNTGVLTQEEFYEVFEALKLTWKLDKVKTLGLNVALATFHAQLHPSILPIFSALRRVAESVFFELAFDIVILVNCFLLMLIAYLSGDNNNVTRSQPFELFFAIVYVFEATFKILAFGPKLYFSKSWNRFDFFVTVVIVVLMIVDFVTHIRSLGAIGLFLRSVRLIRFFKLRQNLRGVLLSMGKLVPGLGRFFVTVALVYYAFAIIGMTAFENTVSTDCDDIVCGEMYDNITGFYQLNNFDNILYAYNTMFELMVVNNWQIIMEGHVAVTNPSSRLYFMIFYLFGVLLVVNVVIAYILDSFGSIFPTIRELKLSEPVEKGEMVTIPMSLARQVFSPGDPDLSLPVSTLHYYAPHRIGKADIYHTLYEDDIQEWIAQDTETRGRGSTISHHEALHEPHSSTSNPLTQANIKDVYGQQPDLPGLSTELI